MHGITDETKLILKYTFVAKRREIARVAGSTIAFLSICYSSAELNRPEFPGGNQES